MTEHRKAHNPLMAKETSRLENLINQALIDILIAKQLISIDELVHSIGRIRMEQEKMLKQHPAK